MTTVDQELRLVPRSVAGRRVTEAICSIPNSEPEGVFQFTTKSSEAGQVTVVAFTAKEAVKVDSENISFGTSPVSSLAFSYGGTVAITPEVSTDQIKKVIQEWRRSALHSLDDYVTRAIDETYGV